MQLTKGSEYALRGLAVLASRPASEAVPLADIAATESIPAAFLAKVFQELVRHGVLVATPGPGNGYALARPAAEISVRQILEAVEGPNLCRHCLLWRGRRAVRGPCLLHDHMNDVLSALTARMERVSLADCAATSKPVVLRTAIASGASA